MRQRCETNQAQMVYFFIHLTQLPLPQKAAGPQTDVLKAKAIFSCDELTALVAWIKKEPTTLLGISEIVADVHTCEVVFQQTNKKYIVIPRLS